MLLEIIRILPDEITNMCNLLLYLQTSMVVGLLFCGALGLLTFFILLLYIRNRASIYLYYFLFLIFSLAGGIINLKHTTWLSSFFANGPGLAQRSLETATLFALFAYCLFTIRLLDIKQQDHKLAKWIVYLAGVTAIYGIIYWFIYPAIADQTTLFFIISRVIILPMSLIAIIWVVCKIHSPIKSYFIIGSAFYFTGALMAVMRETVSAIPFNAFYDYGPTVYFQSGILMETICFALALSHRIYLLYQAKQKEQDNIHAQAVYEKDLANAQMLASRMQINPHFIFNCLNAIKYLIQSEQNSRATKYLTVFSRFVRIVLESGRQSVVSLSEELKITQNYLILEANRFDEHFFYNISVHEDVDVYNVFIPPLLLQPFVENAIWHGLLSSERLPRRLTIGIKRVNTAIIIQIVDNGRGRDSQTVTSSEKFHKSTGMRITAERIDLYNKNYKSKISCITQDKKEANGENGGTIVTLTIDQQAETSLNE